MNPMNVSAPNRNHLYFIFIIWIIGSPVIAAPGDVLFQEDFEGSVSQNWSRSNNTRAGISTQTYNSFNHSLYLRGGQVTVTSDPFNASVTAADLSVWIRRGSDSFSENPDSGEDLLIQYRSTSSWITLETFSGDGTQGEIYQRNYILPADALHSALQIRFSLTDGNNGDYDYWHIDDVIVRESGPVTLNPPVADWRFDEPFWDGTSNEVIDYSCNDYHGTAANTSPIAGATCTAADFRANSIRDYISLDARAMDGLSDFTVSVWVQTNSNSDSTILSAASGNSSLGANEATLYFQNNNRFWPTITASPFDNDTQLSSTSNFNNGAWHHLVWTRKASTATSCFYMDASLQGCIVHNDPDGNDSSPLTVITNGLIIGQEQDSLTGDFELSQDWEGLLDELLIFPEAINSAQINTLYVNQRSGNNWDGSPRVCGFYPCVQLDHYEISLTSPAVTCETEPVTITVIGIDGNPYSPAAGHTINISTSPAADNWTKITGGGSLIYLGGGKATYVFDGTESQVTLGIQRLTPTPVSTPININIIDSNGATESPAADPGLAFVDTAFRFYADGVASAIATQIAGKSSHLAPGNQTLTLRAIETNTDTGACDARLAGPQSIQMAFECYNPSTCKTANGVSISGTSIEDNSQGSVSAYSTVNLTFDANGIAPFTFNYADAGQVVLHAKKELPTTPDHPAFTLSGNSNIFTTKPAGLCIESNDSNSSCTSPYAGCSAFKKAGESFNLTIKAVAWETGGELDAQFCSGNTVTPNFMLNSIGMEHTLIAPTGGNSGTIGTNNIDFIDSDNGTHLSVQTVSEVGAFTFTATPQFSYFGETIQPSTSDDIGRFYPARLLVTSNTPLFNNACEAVHSTAFTYLGQEPSTGGFGFAVDPEFIITAENLHGVFTQNYGADFWKLDSSLNGRAFNNSTSTMAVLSREIQGTTTLIGDADFDSTPPLIALSNSRFMYSRPANEEAPFNALVDLTLTPSDLTDSDGVCFDVASANCNINDGDTGNGFVISSITGAELRYGQGFSQDSYGTMGNAGEYLEVTIGATHWNGSQWVVNTDDSCTNAALTYNSVIELGYSKADSGVSTLATPTPPLSLIGGKADIRLTLQADSNGGETVVTPAWPSWLLGGSPAVAHFGIYRGDDRFIHWREIR
jgi:hypothetical protein